MQPLKINFIQKIKTVKPISWQIFGLSFMVFMALSRWLIGGSWFGLQSAYKGLTETGLLMVAFALILYWWRKDAIFAGRYSASFWVLMLYILWAAITLIWSPILLRAGARLFNLILVIFIAAGIAKQANKQNHAIAPNIASSLTLFITTLLFINILIYQTPFPINVGEGRLGFTLAYDHYNTTGTILGLCCLIACYNLITSESKTLKTLSLVALLFYFVLLLLTSSRTALGATLLSLTVLCFFTFKMKRFSKIIKIIIISFGALVIAGYFFGIIQQYWQILSLTQPEITTLNNRTQLWEVILVHFPENLWGVSFYNSTAFFDLHNTSPSYVGWADHAHNVFFETLLTTGILGALILIGFTATTLSVLMNPTKNPFTSALIIFILIDSVSSTHIMEPSILMFILCVFLFSSQLKSGHTQP